VPTRFVSSSLRKQRYRRLQIARCGHPNSLKIGEHAVAAHVEVLILNVFSKF
jgi:hypothetical protein